VVQQDELESSGVREFLNLGHTFGHALEAAFGYGHLLHGEAVALGMLYATKLAIQLGQFPAGRYTSLLRLYELLGLPTALPQLVDAHQLYRLMQQDKKAHHGQVHFILPVQDFGQVNRRTDVPPQLLDSGFLSSSLREEPPEAEPLADGMGGRVVTSLDTVELPFSSSGSAIMDNTLS